MRGLKNTRAPQQKVVELPADKIREADLIDIELKDLHGNVRTLTELKGKVVLLDFTVYENAASATRNLALREVYDKYHAQGFEIYQISLDADEHFWKTSADNLPWVCVRDAAGIYSNYLGIYAVNSLPSFFLINRNNVLTARGETVKDLDEAIKKLL
jgi:peroxiredoxin